MNKLYLLVIALCIQSLSFAQGNTNIQRNNDNYPVWAEMMQDENANFYQTQAAFEQFYAQRTRSKGDGWKPFKRWEWYMESRVNADGSRIAPSTILWEYKSFVAQYGNSPQKSSTATWTELGPVGMPTNGTGQPNGLGRVNGIGFHPTDANTFYIAAPSGGIWKTTNGGSTWSPLTDTLPTLGTSCIQVHPTNPNIVYVGTGDRDGYDAPGMGVIKSTDGGNTWTFANTGMGNKIVSDLLIHPSSPNTLIAATNGGIYRTTNGGTSWTKTSSSSSHFKDLEFKPNSPNTVYASGSSFFYKSTDNGVTWTSISSGLPGNGRYAIAVTPANSNYVYLVSGGSNGLIGLYRSTNSGTSFSSRSTSPNILGYSSTGSDTRSQAWYDLAIAADPSNANTIYVGGINIWKSTNGGSSWSLNAHWVGSGGVPAVHADIHSLDFSPVNSRLYCGNDGGLYYSTNGGSTWPEISNGLAIAQVYKIGQSASSKNLIINGYQDNGTAIYSNGSWDTEIGGDGMECAVDPSNTSYLYGSLYYGDIRRSSNGGTWFDQIAGDQVNGITEEGGWVTPYILDVNNSNTMILGMKNIWRSTNVKTASAASVSWTKLTNNLGGSNSQNIKVIEQSEANSNILYFSRADDKLFRSDNFNNTSPTFTDISSNLPNSSYYPTDIEADPHNPNTVFMTLHYDVYKSTNKGASWTMISGNLPNIPMNCLVLDTSSTNEALYVGTDAGVYYKDNTMTQWILYMDGMPVSAEITELEIYYSPNGSNSSIVASTYGRGLWQSDLYASGSALPIAHFGYNDEVICSGDTIQFTDSSLFNPTTYAWSFSPSNVTFVNGTSASSQHPEVKFSNAGYYSVTLTVSNANGSDSKTISNLIKAGGYQVPFLEGFESNSATLSDWGISNPDNATTWSIASTSGISGSSRSVFMDNFNYNASGQSDYLFSPIINLSGFTGASLAFKHAYTRYTNYPSDSLIIYASTNCGSSWSQIASYGEDGTGSFATAPDNTYASGNAFSPSSASDWCGSSIGAACDSLDLSTLAGNDNVMIVFQAINKYSNNLYLDDILVDGSNNLPVTASFTNTTTSTCTGVPITFNNTSQNATSYIWKENGVVISTSAQLQHSFTTSGTKVIRLIASNSSNIDSTSQTITVTASAGQAATPTGNTAVCQGTSTSSYNTTGAANANTYAWSISPSSAGTISGTSTSATVTWAASFTGTASIGVVGSNSCGMGANANPLTVNISAAPSAAGTISGNTTLCVNPANSTYSIASIPNASTYSWNLTPSSAGTINGNGNSITIDWNNSYVGQASLTVYGSNSCGNGTSSTPLTIDVLQGPGVPGTPTGTTTVCSNSGTSTYTSSGTTNTTSYQWTLNPTAAGTISGTGTSATVTWNSTFSGTASISIEGISACGTGPSSATLSVTVNSVPNMASTPSGPNVLCENPLNGNFATTAISNATSYSWALLPANAGVISGTGNNITIDWDNQFTGSANLKVAGVNTCGTGDYSPDLAIVIHSNPTIPTITKTFDSLISSSATGNQWYNLSGMINGANNFYFIPQANGDYYVVVTNSYGCEAQSASFNVNDVAIKDLILDKAIRMYPNPANDQITIEYEGSETLTLEIRNVLGQVVQNPEVNGTERVALNSFSNGVYYFVLYPSNDKGQAVTQKIIIYHP